MIATVPHVTSGLGLRKFQADGFFLIRVYNGYRVFPGGKAAGAWRLPPTRIYRRCSWHVIGFRAIDLLYGS